MEENVHLENKLPHPYCDPAAAARPAGRCPPSWTPGCAPVPSRLPGAAAYSGETSGCWPTHGGAAAAARAADGRKCPLWSFHPPQTTAADHRTRDRTQDRTPGTLPRDVLTTAAAAAPATPRLLSLLVTISAVAPFQMMLPKR